MFHIDLTYKIVKQSYPLLVFGNSDIVGRFHPICFMFLSHWTQCDFDFFFQKLFDLLNKKDIEINIKYLMQDADKACLNSVQKNLPDTKSLMCFFHVMQNVRKHKHLIKDNEHYELVKTDIRKLNKCVSKKMFENLKKKILINWSKLGLVEFRDYFEKQWLNSEFCNWSIYHTDPGMAATNNPVESFNSIIKRFFTLRFKENMLITLENFKENLIFYNHQPFSSVSKFSKATISRGRDLVEKRSTFLKLKKNCYEYKNEENVLFKIIIDENDLKNSKKNFLCLPTVSI
jgi:hypothetical protein